QSFAWPPRPVLERVEALQGALWRNPTNPRRRAVRENDSQASVSVEPLADGEVRSWRFLSNAPIVRLVHDIPALFDLDELDARAVVPRPARCIRASAHRGQVDACGGQIGLIMKTGPRGRAAPSHP